MKKICLLIFFTTFLSMLTSLAIGWELSDDSKKCFNENLDPCSSSETLSSKSKEDSEVDLDKVLDKKKEKVAKKKIEKKKEKVVKKKKKIVKKKIKRKEKKIVKVKNIFLRTSSIKSDKDFDFDRDISFEDFKTLLINYTDNSDYPNIDN